VQVAVGEEFSLVLTLTGVVYSFGAGQEGQLGHPNPDDVSKGCPCPIEAFGERSIRVAKIAAGYEHAMAIDGAHTTLALFFLSTDQPTNQPTNQPNGGSGKLHLWGSNKYGQLGFGREAQKELVPRLLPLEHSVVDAAGGKSHTAVVSQEGLVYTW